MTPTSQIRNQSVDTFRLLAALFIIALHVRYSDAPREIAVGLRLMSRWAIPFFFIVSGYFLARKYSQTGKLNVQPTLERLIWMFILWVIIYAPFVIRNHDLAMLLKLITMPTFIYFGLFSHLWFLPSLLFGYLFLSFTHRYKIIWALPFFSALSLFMALVSGAYNIFDFGFPLDYEVARTWLSIPFLYAGFLFYQKGFPRWVVSGALILFGAGLQIFEARYLYAQFEFSAYDHQFLIGTIPFALGMASLALNNLKFLQHPILSKWGNEYSLGIYLIHPAMIFLFSPVFSRAASGLMKLAAWQVAYPLVILLISLTVLHALKRILPAVFNVLFGAHIATSTDD